MAQGSRGAGAQGSGGGEAITRDELKGELLRLVSHDEEIARALCAAVARLQDLHQGRPERGVILSFQIQDGKALAQGRG